jgi:hypothetical protein
MVAPPASVTGPPKAEVDVVAAVVAVVAGVVSVVADVSVAGDDDVELPPPQAVIKADVITAIKVKYRMNGPLLIKC